MSQKKVAIGIDLGTTKCCVSAVCDGKLETFTNERGSKTTPSYVAFTDTERLIGDDAKDQATLNPTNTIFRVKKIIGTNLGDAIVKKTTKDMPYFIDGNADEIYINVTYKREEEVLLLQQVTAMLLTKMKQLAEDRLGCSVEDAVISVPASFSNAQRQATKDAANIAGLKVLALVNEPTAAAIAYQANRKGEAEENIAVVDFGGGKLDVAIVSVSNVRIAVKGLSGTTDLGGNDVDEILMEHVVDKFREKFSHDPPKEKAVFECLRVACVKLKHVLSLLPKVQYQIDCFGNDFALPISMSCADYTDMISNKISPCLDSHLTHTLQMSGLNKQNISKVVLVGGSTRIPLVSDEIKSFFHGSKLDSSVDPDEAVAHGAAIYAALLSGDSTVTQLTVDDMLPNSFCFSAEGSREVKEIFPNDCIIPASKEFSFNGEDLSQRFELYEKLSDGMDPHRLIGTLCLSQEFTKAVRLVTGVVFEIGRCGILDVIVHLGPTQDPNYAFCDVVKNYSGRLSSERLREAFDRDQLFRRDEKDENDSVEASTIIESGSSRLQGAIQTNESRQQFPDLVAQVNTEAVETINWPETEENVDKSDCDTEEKSLEELENAAAVKQLRSYSSDVASFLSNADITEVPQIADEVKEQLRLLDKWLQSVTDRSKADCDYKREVLDNLLRALEQALERKRPERERKASVNDLRAYCSEIQISVSNKPAYQTDLQLVEEINEEAKDILKWLKSNEFASKEECTRVKTSLKDKFKVLQRRADKRQRESDAELEKERFDVANVLWGRCHGFRSNVRTSNIDSFDAPLAKHIFTQVDDIIHWLTRTGKLASVVECDKRTELITNYEALFGVWVKEHEKKVLEQKRENIRADIRKKEDKERSDVFLRGEQQRSEASEKEGKKEEKERTEAIQKEEKQLADALHKEEKQQADALHKEEKQQADAIKKQDKARVDATRKQNKERADAVKKQDKERAGAAKKQDKARAAACKKQDKERLEAAKYSK